MILFPAIDLVNQKAVRLLKGDYSQMTIYSDKPIEVAKTFEMLGARHIHMVDLEGARDGNTPNLELILRIKRESGLFCEIGGGIRRMETVQAYLDGGLDRVILGTAAVKDPAFLEAAVGAYGEKIAVGVDIRDGFVAIQGWTEQSGIPFMDFCRTMAEKGVGTLICTDISRDGAMRGTNRELYRQLSRELKMQITASGGVSTLEDIRALREMNLYGAIIGKAYYTGDIRLEEAIREAQD
jgi:phosphoribosylformimino-5-aminoimidazole carboxamide ribotide isomerase